MLFMFRGSRQGPEHQEDSQLAEGIPMRSVRTRNRVKAKEHALAKISVGQTTTVGVAWTETTWNKMKSMKPWEFYPNGSKWHDKDMFNRMAQDWRQVYISAWIRISNRLLSGIGPRATYHQKYQNIGIFTRQKATIPRFAKWSFSSNHLDENRKHELFFRFMKVKVD